MRYLIGVNLLRVGGLKMTFNSQLLQCDLHLHFGIEFIAWQKWPIVKQMNINYDKKFLDDFSFIAFIFQIYRYFNMRDDLFTKMCYL